MRYCAHGRFLLRACLRRSEEHTSELQSHVNLVCRLLLEKKNQSLNRSSVRCLLVSQQVAQDVAGSAAADADFFFFNDTATTEIYTLSLHDALPISLAFRLFSFSSLEGRLYHRCAGTTLEGQPSADRKSTRLNSSHMSISYAVF